MKNSEQISFTSNRNALQKYKVVLVGDQSAGKSSIIIRYIKNEFDKSSNPTIGIDFTSKNVTLGPKTVRLQLWDTAGQQRFRSLIPSYLKDCSVAIIVFDLSNDKASENINQWIDFVRESRGSEAIIYVVGNKRDLDSERQNDSIQKIREIVEQQKLPYIEASAKSGEGVAELFGMVVEKLVSLQGNGETVREGNDDGEGKVGNGAKAVALRKNEKQGQQARGFCC